MGTLIGAPFYHGEFGEVFVNYRVLHEATGATFSIEQVLDSSGNVLIRFRSTTHRVFYRGSLCDGDVFIAPLPSGIIPSTSFGELISTPANNAADTRFFLATAPTTDGVYLSKGTDNISCSGSAGEVTSVPKYEAVEVTMPFSLPLVPPLQIVEGAQP